MLASIVQPLSILPSKGIGRIDSDISAACGNLARHKGLED